MSIKSRTIDNLGIETSSRYARDQATLDTKLIEESRFIPQKAETAVLRPYVSSDFEEYLMSGKLVLWASFEPPPEGFMGTKPLFSYQLIPSLGGYEKQEEDTTKLEALEDTINKQFKEGKRDQKRDQQEGREEEKERKVLLGLLQTIEKLDRTLTLINSRRNQYQRG